MDNPALIANIGAETALAKHGGDVQDANCIRSYNCLLVVMMMMLIIVMTMITTVYWWW